MIIKYKKLVLKTYRLNKLILFLLNIIINVRVSSWLGMNTNGMLYTCKSNVKII